ncbi:MAG: hypothetical protein J5I47_00675 [Vicingus serpentipes]|nr:hypothetical protein [Vicingus serpentipes]
MESLINLDAIYKETVQYLPKEERIEYCEHYIDRATKILANNGQHLDSDQKQKLQKMIDAARKEIYVIKNK